MDQSNGEAIPATVVKTTIKVWGNCENCQSTIESAAKLKGVDAAYWDSETKMLNLAYDSALISLTQIEKSIADSGYDNDGFKAPQLAYDKLAPCCQYERK